MKNFMEYLTGTVMGLMILLLLMVARPAIAQTMQCGPNNGAIQAQLVDRHDETIIYQKDVPSGRAEVWSNDDTGTFTLLFFPAGQNEEVVCIAGRGQSDDLIDKSQPV